MAIQIYTIVVWRSFWWSLAVEGWMFWLTGGLVYLIAIHGIASLFDGTDKLTHTRGLELQNSCGDSIITDRWLHFERNLMQKKTEYSHF